MPPAAPPASAQAHRHSPVRLRLASSADVPLIADLYLRSRQASIPAIPPGVHDDDDVRHWVATVVFPDSQRLEDHELWVAVMPPPAGEVVAFMALAGDWIAQLYVAPEHTGHGIGTVMVERAKERRPHQLQLWAFESNVGARRFYERHGFVAVGRTDGDNEEGAPDVRYRWVGDP